MIFQQSTIQEREDNFYKNIIRLYLKYGSVDEVVRRTKYSLPISYPGMHHLIRRWGIVKSAGPNSKLSEALTVLTMMSDSKLPLERIYKSLPPSFKTSLSTLHRIMHNVKEGVTRRYGTALVVTTKKQREKVLVGQDMDHSKSLTLPMTYSVHNEDPRTSILRVLQQEVFSDLAVEKKLTISLISKNPKPFMFLNIADIKVAVYQIKLSEEFLLQNNFSSGKIADHRLESIYDILNTTFPIRAGVKDIIRGYEHSLTKDRNVIVETSAINLALLRV